MNAALARQRDRIRAMTADEKVQLAQAIWLESWRVTTAGVRARHQDWSAEEIHRRVRELMSDAGA